MFARLVMLTGILALTAPALADEDAVRLPTRAEVVAEIEVLVAEAYSEDPARALDFLVDSAFVLEAAPAVRSEFRAIVNSAQSLYVANVISVSDNNLLGRDLVILLHIAGRTRDAEDILEGQLETARVRWGVDGNAERLINRLSDAAWDNHFLGNPLRVGELLDEAIALARLQDPVTHYEALRERIEFDLEAGNFAAAARRNAELAGIVADAALAEDNSYLSSEWPEIAHYAALTEGEAGRRIAMDWARSNFDRPGEYGEFLLRLAEDLPSAVQGAARLDVLNRALLQELSESDGSEVYSLARLALLYAEASECQIAMSLVGLSEILSEIDWVSDQLGRRERLEPPSVGGPNVLTTKRPDLPKAQNSEENSDYDVIYLVHERRPFSHSSGGYLARARIECGQTYEAVRAILEDRAFEPENSVWQFWSIEESIENEADRRVFREAVGRQVNVRQFLEEPLPERIWQRRDWSQTLAYMAGVTREAGRGQDANRLTRAAIKAMEGIESSDRIEPLAQLLAALPE